MRLLALDLGTTTGFCCGTREHNVSGTWGLKQDRFSGAGMRYVRFRGHLNETHNAYRFEQVAFEEVRRHLGTDAAHIYGGLIGMLTAWCEERKVPYQGVPVGTIKKFATGKGNASKQDMIDAVRDRWGVITDDHNEADAIALFWQQQCTTT